MYFFFLRLECRFLYVVGLSNRKFDDIYINWGYYCCVVIVKNL